jgi:putative protease
MSIFNLIKSLFTETEIEEPRPTRRKRNFSKRPSRSPKKSAKKVARSAPKKKKKTGQKKVRPKERKHVKKEKPRTPLRKKREKISAKKRPLLSKKARVKKVRSHSAKSKREEKIIKGKEIGRITHYFDKIEVGIIKLFASLKVGEKIHIKGAHVDFAQVVQSMQLNHQNIVVAKPGDEVGVKVIFPVQENNKVYQASS